MCKSFKLLRERNAKLLSKRDPIYFGIFVFVGMILLNLFLPKVENFWMDVLIKGGIIGVILALALLLMYEFRARKEKRKS
jgi:predicted tellurium resistance membrane protein TerC